MRNRSLNRKRAGTGSESKRRKRIRPIVFARDGWQCVNCGWNEEFYPAEIPPRWLTLEHKVPFAAGGKTSLDNCETLCNVCNNLKSIVDQRLVKTLIEFSF